MLFAYRPCSFVWQHLNSGLRSIAGCGNILCRENICIFKRYISGFTGRISNYLSWQVKGMQEKDNYYVVKKKALPEVLIKVVEVKRLLESNSKMTVWDAAEQVGLSRSSFYKYKDDIFPFRDNAKGKTITFVIQVDDEPGLLSRILGKIADYKANVLTIHQTIPINKIASLTLSVDILNETGDSSSMIEEIEHLSGVHYLKILSRE